MLRVRAHAGKSQVHRLGLIAQEFIPADTLIWEFMPEFDVAISEDLFQRLSHSTREQVCYYAYFDCEQSCYKLSSDDERFANHSDTPNTRSIGDQVYAARDIAAGEEITIDYREDGEYGFPQPGEYGFPWRGKGGDDGREELRNERRIPSS